MILIKSTCKILFIIPFLGFSLMAASNEDCMDCHEDEEMTMERGSREISVYVNINKFQKSVHGEQECIDCHSDADVDDFPHEDELANVYCGDCHDDVQLDFEASIHGQALNRNAPYAPTCSECHGTHEIKSNSDPSSKTFKMNIPIMCGRCHKEGAPVARAYKIHEHNILENYSQSIHGEGLFKKGLVVSAACTDCHSSHLILPRTSKASSISAKNIAETCMNCHLRIEEVHTKIIRGELWENKPGAIPACTDCHVPHKVRKETLELTLSDKSCLKCHKNKEIHKIVNEKKISLTVDKDILEASVHKNIPCVKCHSDINPSLMRPCIPAINVDCSNCHAKISDEYFASSHGKDHLEDNPNVPYCTDCHGEHDVKSHLDETSFTFRSTIPTLCGNCHKKDSDVEQISQLHEVSAFTDYSKSIHGIGLIEKGLLPSAICTDCHNSHMILGLENPKSSVYYKNILATCSTCHRGIFKKFTKSIHFFHEGETEEKLPICSDCHSSHTISSVEKDKFMTEITDQCGFCHQNLSDTYFETMHGKAYHLGYLDAAKCSDCHGAHEIRDVNDPNSTVGYKNVVATCQKCHEDANERFTGYLTHATHHDPAKYPILYYTYWIMTSLLIGVFGIFGLHTLMWLPRSIRQMRARKKTEKDEINSGYYIKRFSTPQRITHILVIITFILLALTGMMLKFSNMPWAQTLADLFGGVHSAGLIHRISALVMFGYFIFHIYSLYQKKKSRKESWIQFLFKKNTLMFNLQDLKDFYATIKWFWGVGKRPNYGKWTYWEKFDYFAVFWGVFIIGFSGLIKWFPEFFTLFFPGWLINVAAIIHSDEALLAVGFIFTIHFFNTHLRPDVFPMDKVIFTGLIPLEEFKKDRPREYAELRKRGKLKKRVVKTTISPRLLKISTIFGSIALFIGILLIGLILYSVLVGYN
jgi:cytochrome b subunit of formate dehydrogenase